jgi:hypothetical protein
VLQDAVAAETPLLAADVVVRRRAGGAELFRTRKPTEFQAQQLLAEVSTQLDELPVDEFCARWGATWTDA